MTVTYLPATHSVHDEAVRQNFEYIESHAMFLGGGLVPCRAYRTAALTLTAGAWRIVPLDTVSFDVGKRWDTVNGWYTVPEDGDYLCSGAVIINSTTGAIIAGLAVNTTIPVSRGSIVPAVTVGAVNTAGGSISDILSLKVGDHISLAVYSVNADALFTGSAGSFLSVVRIS